MLSDEDHYQPSVTRSYSQDIMYASSQSTTKMYVLIFPLDWRKFRGHAYPHSQGFLHPEGKDHLKLVNVLEQGACCTPKASFPRYLVEEIFILYKHGQGL